MNEINEKVLNHLAELARIEIEPDKKDKLLKDFKSILSHFEELADLDTSNIAPMTGGTNLKNVVREDDPDADLRGRGADLRGKGTEAFPETKDGYLKVPPVFE